ncbi:SDR family oxidoreductase [Clostridium pasteurianum]|uniref:Short-chain alcohol dehydrogenase n=1 Tax=Clostridium pasteurianum BC1 TaxID=86416 RepID=R4K7L6_CLOPA|nr:SDR family oxidoreductase [Clostridium pasteurianum]AGK98528.1 short-chain alcohol dehydrogenase [Clostridium pasteurianum BC1]
MKYKKTAVITGASSGIGRAIAKSLAKEGTHVYITGQSQEKLDLVRSEIQSLGGTVDASAFDIRDIAKLQNFIQQAKEQTGHLDIMVNNAGIHIHGKIVETDPESWRQMIDVNILALLVGSQAAIRVMRENPDNEGGHIINISSGNAKEPGKDFYGSTKHMVNALCETLTQELADEPIRLTNIMPGAVATNFGRSADPAIIQGLATKLGMNVEIKKGEHLSDELLKRIHAAMGQIFLSPEDIANAVMYALAQPKNVVMREMYLCAPKVYLGKDFSF